MIKIKLRFKSYERYVRKLEWLYKYNYKADTSVENGLFCIEYWKK